MSRSTVEVLERPQAKTSKQDLIRQEDGDEDMENDFDMAEKEMSDKDETELELERLVFGDSAGFREGLNGSALAVRESKDDDEQTHGLDGLDDADVGQALKPRYSSSIAC